jgi:glycosyltransferase involved in cell wall biosynthesis
MLKVYINRKPIIGPYGGGNMFLQAFYRYAKQNGFQIIETNKYRNFDERPDMIFVMSPHADGQDLSLEEILCQYQQKEQEKIKLVLRVNECDARKATQGVDKLWHGISSDVDGTIWVSNWLKNYFWKSVGWQCRDYKFLRNTIIVNGVDKTIFKPNKKFDNGKINIVCHHWSDNEMKGSDYIKWLDDYTGKNSDRYTYTFIGRTKVNLDNSRHIPPLFGKQLGDELGKYDVCVNASRFDPGPNSTIEAISCGLPTYVHIAGGGSVEFAGSDHIFSDENELEQILNNPLQFNQTSFLSWELVMKQIFDYMKELYYVTKC